MSAERSWRVHFLGDPEYGRDSWEYATADGQAPTIIEAANAGTAVRKALVQWKREDVTCEEGWYGEGTIVGVQEVLPPPPVKTFVVESGRPKLERRA